MCVTVQLQFTVPQYLDWHKYIHLNERAICITDKLLI